jgi:hypothetical protein
VSVKLYIAQSRFSPIEVVIDGAPPCLYCGEPVTAPSTDGPLVCCSCDCGCNRDGSRWTAEQARDRRLHFQRKVDEYRDLHDKRIGVDPTDVECPTCSAWKGWACEGERYGYHAAGYHLERHEAARKAKEIRC